MFDRDTLALFMMATLALNVSPGPDMMYVVGRTASGGLRAGFVSAIGISGGIALHIVALVTGVGTLLARSHVAFTVVQTLGAGYLIWLGIGALRQAWRTGRGVPRPPVRGERVFLQGVLTSALNPKIALFFLAFLPQFVDPTRGAPAYQLVVLGTLFITSGTIVNLLVALAVSQSVARVAREESAGKWLSAATGILFLALAGRLLWTPAD